MSSIRQTQTQRALQDIAHALYSRGVDPMLAEIFGRLNRYFGQYPAGKPLPMGISGLSRDGVSDHESYNELMRNLALNLDILYETSLNHVDDVLMLNDAIHSRVQNLKSKQRRLEAQINDHLMVHHNSDGYFYTISDNFSDIQLVDTTLTSARVDTESGAVTIPSISDHSYQLGPNHIGAPSVSVTVNGQQHAYRQISPFSGALEDGLNNLMWAIEVELDKPSEVYATVDIPVYSGDGPIEITRIDLKPYGMSPVQSWMEVYDPASGVFVNFGARAKTDSLKMTFVDNVPGTTTVRMHLRKTEYDYTQRRDGGLRYRYVFGAKAITMLHSIYEKNARLVSLPLSTPTEARDSLIIDGISVDVDVDVPSGGDVRFFVAAADPIDFSAVEQSDVRHVADLNWHEITPIRSTEKDRKLVRFDGAATQTKLITDNPTNDQLQLIPIAPSGPEQDRNPSHTIIEGVDVYKITQLDSEPLVNSLTLLEGVNTTRIYSKSIDSSLQFADMDIGYWADIFRNQADELILDYGKIDIGNGFFYGGDVGAPGRDIYVETFLETQSSYNTFLAEMQKVDDRSRTWDVKAFLNGRPLGNLPAGVNSTRLPWSFQDGLNHVVVMVRIPLESAQPMPYVGVLSLMGDAPNLPSYGAVRLDKWNYVDEFTMRYNEMGQPKTFTVKDGLLISRREPTANFQLRYSSKTGYGPEAIRFMAELSRVSNNPKITPKLNSYRLRFSYSGDYS